MIKAILFDWAGVIANDVYWSWLKENVEDLEIKKGFFQKLSERVDIGEINEVEFINLVEIHSQKNTFKEDFFKKLKLNKDVLGLIKKLKKHYKVALLSNYLYAWLNEILILNNLYETFDETLISSTYKMIKPHKEIFQKMLDLLKLKKDEVIFIDDRQNNVDGATKFGIKAFLYTDTNKLKQDLINSSIIID